MYKVSHIFFFVFLVFFCRSNLEKKFCCTNSFWTLFLHVIVSQSDNSFLFLKLLTNHIYFLTCLTCYVDTVTSTIKKQQLTTPTPEVTDKFNEHVKEVVVGVVAGPVPM